MSAVPPQNLPTPQPGGLTALGNQGIGDASLGLGIYTGLNSGTAQGDARAGLQTGKLAGNLSGNSALNTGATEGLDAMNIYSGIQQGGLTGYGRAAGSGIQLAGMLADNPALSAAGGYILAPLSVYNAVNNWQSGKTGSNALNGASAGAAIGSIVPGIGTLIGGVIGGAVGALSSAFGPGATDPETTDVKGLINATSANQNSTSLARSASDPYLELAGLMDEKSSTLPMYQQYGRMGEQAFTNAMTQQINQAVAKDPSLANDPTAVYNQVVAPWVNSMGSGYSNVGSTYTATTQGLLEDMTQQYLSGNAAQDWKSVGGQEPFANIYQGTPLAGTAADAAAQATLDKNIAAYNASNQQANQQQSAAHAAGTQLRARGGHVDDNNMSARLKELYKGSFQKRKVHYDDGGGAYVDYANNPNTDSISSQYSAPSGSLSFQPSLTNYGDIGTGFSDIDNPYSGINQSGLNPDNVVNPSNDPYAYGTAGSTAKGGTSSSNPYAGLGNLLQGLGVSGSTLSSIAPLAALAPLLASVLGTNKGASAPTLPSQYTGQLLNMQTPPAATRQQTDLSGRTMQQWLTGAEGPETNFYTNNATPTTAMSAQYPTSNIAQGPQSNPYNATPTTAMSAQQPTSNVAQGEGPYNGSQLTSNIAQGEGPYTGSQSNPYNVVPAQMMQAPPQNQQQASPGMAQQSQGAFQIPGAAAYQAQQQLAAQQANALPVTSPRPVMNARGGRIAYGAGGRAGDSQSPYSTTLPPQGAPYMPPYHANAPTTPVVNPHTRMADGGLTSLDSTGSGLGGLGHVKGPGDGTSDSIKLKNAYLSNGEYVIDAPTVSALGNGSNDAGAKAFDQIRKDIRTHAGKKMVKGRQPMTAARINVQNYMGGGQ